MIPDSGWIGLAVTVIALIGGGWIRLQIRVSRQGGLIEGQEKRIIALEKEHASERAFQATEREKDRVVMNNIAVVLSDLRVSIAHIETALRGGKL